MPTVHLEVQVSPEQLRPDESDLLQKINQGIPLELRDHYETLIGRRRSGALTPDEHDELLRVTDQVEALEAERAENLARLARLRGVPLAALLDSLGIHAAEHE